MPLPEGARVERAAWLRLALTPGIGPAATRDLLAAFGLPEEVLAAGSEARARVVGAPLARAIAARDPERERAIEAALEWASAEHHHLVSLADPLYPKPLLQIGDPPPLLYVAGDPRVLSLPALAMVGSRSASATGAETAEAFAAALAATGLAIVSGLALGIDAASHRGALRSGGATVAVLGTGADRVYPAGNRELARAIVARGGALVSELPLGTGVRRDHFPRRNRLIAGLSLGVLVVEAALRSGSLGTARQAGEFGREVFAIPGSIHSPLAKGCHLLIKQGARLVESASDVLDELAPAAAPGKPPGKPPGKRPGAAPGAAPAGLAPGTPGEASAAPGDAPAPRAVAGAGPLEAAMGWDPVSAETLARRLPALSVDTISARLLELELEGRAERLDDGRYRLRPPARA